MHKLILGLVAFAMLALPSACSIASDGRDAMEAATVPMSVMRPDKTFFIACTAFAVADHVLATANHCLTARPNAALFFGEERTYSPEDKVLLVVHDTVFIKTKRAWKHKVEWSERAPRKYEKLYGFGYGLGLPKVYREGVYGGKWVFDEDAEEWKGWPAWLSSIPLAPGDSGMAIVGEHHKVFCVASSVLSSDKGGAGVSTCMPISLTPAQRKLVYGP